MYQLTIYRCLSSVDFVPVRNEKFTSYDLAKAAYDRWIDGLCFAANIGDDSYARPWQGQNDRREWFGAQVVDWYPPTEQEECFDYEIWLEKG